MPATTTEKPRRGNPTRSARATGAPRRTHTRKTPVIRAAVVSRARAKIESGFYESDRVLDTVTRRLLRDLAR